MNCPKSSRYVRVNCMEIENFDIIVSGGGIAGCACAYIAAKFGLNVLLVERATYLGGQITGGLVVPSMKTNSQNLNTEFFSDLISECKKFDAQITYGDGNSAWFNTELLKIVLDNMLTKVGCKILLEAEVSKISKTSNSFRGEIFSEFFIETLSLPFFSKYIVDGTGIGKICEKLNCEFWNDSKQKQPNSLRFNLSGVDIKVFCEFLKEIDTNWDTTNYYELGAGELHFTTAYTWDSEQNWALTPYFKKAVENGDLELNDTDYFQIFSVAKAPNTVSFNCPRLKQGTEGESTQFDRTNSIIAGRKAILRLRNFCKKYLKGFENAYISNIADMVGVREFRRVKCEYDFTIDDIYEPKDFANAVLYSDYPIDIHSNEKDGSTLKKIQTYSFPLESLIVKGFNNLFVVGKCLGADFKAQASLRVQNSCMSMGEGVARHIASQ